MNRREFMARASCAAALLPLPVLAQSSQQRRIGFLGNSTPELEANLIGPFRQALRELGYVEGANIAVIYRWAEGRYDRFPALIEDLARQEVEVIVTAGTPAALAVKKATRIPLVMVAVGDPVGTGLADSLAHPGSTATGLTSIAPELEGKRLELLREVVPALSRIAVLWNPSNAYMIATEKQVRAACEVLGIRVDSLAVTSVKELDSALSSLRKERPDALNVLADRLFLHNRARIVAFALENRLPGVHAYRELVEAGGLMSFGPSYADMHRRAATYVAKILGGASPGELPIERPVKFELVINVTTARKLGLALPQSILLRADEVIE
jgi:putative ABC transport system substrate-binding protein